MKDKCELCGEVNDLAMADCRRADCPRIEGTGSIESKVKNDYRKWQEEQRERRRRCVRLGIHNELSLKKKELLKIFEALPDDVFVERIRENFEMNCWEMLLSSMQFDRVHESMTFPQANAEFTMDDAGEIAKIRFLKFDGTPLFKESK